MAPEDDAMMARFRADYLALLDQRVVTIQTHLQVGNEMTAQVAMLSLESTSTMVGACDLAAAVAQLRAALERGDRDELGVLTDNVVREADRTRARLAPSA